MGSGMVAAASIDAMVLRKRRILDPVSDAPVTEVDERPTPPQAAAEDARMSLRPLSAAIYGQIVVTSVIAALEVHEPTPPAETFAAVAGTIVVFWAAHVYSEALARVADRGTILGMLIAESTMLAVAVPSLWLLAFGAFGWLS